VSTQRRHYVGKDGVERVYETHLLRRSGVCPLWWTRDQAASS
jgi:hypothetical protein